MSDDPDILEVGRGSDSLGSVDDTVWNHKVPRGDFLSQGADSGKGNDCLYADGLEGGNVGTSRHLGRSMLVVEPVTGQERDLGAGRKGGDRDRGGGETPWLENHEEGFSARAPRMFRSKDSRTDRLRVDSGTIIERQNSSVIRESETQT